MRKLLALKRSPAERSFGWLVVVVGIALVRLAGGSVWAAQVNWGSDRFATNLTGGGAMDESFTFELGAFEPGFEPTEANRDQWSTRWRAAATAGYHGTAHFFSGSVVVDGTNPAFAPTNQGYIWGFDSRESGRTVEWILITHPDWRWPAGSGTAAPIEWCVAGASVAVVGGINASDGSWHMRSARLTLGLDPGGWREATFGASAPDLAVAGWEADPDGDGFPNILEFALGTEALRGNGGGGITLGFEQRDGGLHRTLSVARVRRASIDYIPELSSDLVTWSSGGDVFEIVEDRENRLTVRDRMPFTGGRGFLRLRVAFRVED